LGDMAVEEKGLLPLSQVRKDKAVNKNANETETALLLPRMSRADK